MASKPPTVSEFWTDDLDHAVEHLRGRSVEHSRVPVGKAPFGWGYRAVSGERVSSGAVRNAGAHVLHATLPSTVALVHVPLRHACDYRVGRRALTVSAGRALVLPPDFAYTVRDPGGATLSLVVSAESLLERLDETWPGRRGHVALRPTELSLDGPGRAQLQGLLRRFERLGGAPLEKTEPAAADFIEDEIIDWLAAAIVRQDGVHPLSPRRRQRIGWVENYIDAHLGEPIDLARLARVSRVGARALTKATQAARGLSPMDLVLARRLTAAWRSISGGDTRTIARIASDCGFTHLGRFAAAYRAAYGELPSETMARRRRDS